MFKIIYVVSTALILNACVGYGGEKMVIDNADNDVMALGSQAVQATEKVERAERLSERHEERMNEADAYEHATNGSDIYLLY